MAISPIVSRRAGVTATVGATVREIWSLSDFYPSGGIIELTAGHYQIKDTIDIGSNRFVFGPGNPFVLMQFDDSFNNYILSTGSDMTIISGKGAIRLLHGKGNAFVMEGDNVTFVDVIGSFGALYSYIGFFGGGYQKIGFVRGKLINQSATAGLILREMIIDGWTDGITIDNGIETSSRDVGGTASPNATGAFLHVRGKGLVVIATGSNMVIPTANASFIDVDPTVEITVAIDKYFVSGGGKFFRPGTKNGAFTAVADASVGATGTNVTDSSGVARFNFTGPTLYTNQKVTISGFVTNAAEYNGDWTITSTDGVSWFEIDIIDFGSAESGSFLSDSVTLTEAATTVADGDSILIDADDCTCYDIGSFVYNKQAGSFQISAPYTTTAVGTWRDGSQTEGDKYVLLSDCGEQADSQYLGATYVTGNVGTTSVTNDWGDLNLVAAIDSVSSSRFKLINAVTGEQEYTGLNPLKGVVFNSISAFKSAATAVLHQFRAVKTVGSPAFEGILAEREFTDKLGTTFLLTPVYLEPGDRFKIQVRSPGTTSTTTIQNITTIAIK